MTPAGTRRRIRISSAAIVFAAAAAVWYVWLSRLLDELSKPTGQQAAGFRVALYSTLPIAAIALVAFIVCNVTQSEGTAWAVSLVLAVIVAFVYLSMLSRAATSFS